MKKDEIIDIFDANFNLIGKEKRSIAHKKGLWHQVFFCWVFRKEKDKIFVLFQKRGKNKKAFPNLLDISVAGHLEANEKPIDGIREAKEEIGLEINSKKLDYLGKYIAIYDLENDYKEREFSHVFFYKS